MNLTASAVDFTRLTPSQRRYASIPGGLCLSLNSSNYKERDIKPADKPKSPAPKVSPNLLKGRSEAERFHLQDLNERCAVSVLGSTARIIWQPDPAKPPKFLSSKDAREMEATRIVTLKGENGGTTKLKMFNEWFEWAGRRQYDEIRFAPGSDDPNIYNLFAGWDVEPSHDGNWSILRGHIENVICSGDEQLFAWFMTWLAHMFQHPAEKIPVAVVIRGKKGTGKSIVFDFIQQLMSGYFTKIADGKRALGNFNSQYETTLLLLMEEAFWAGDQSKESILKDMITSSTQRIERKGIEPYVAPNYMRVAMISNERWVVPASHDERRYAFLDCSDQRRGDGGYFKDMVSQMEAGGLAAMLHDLLNYEPANGWDVLFKAPTSAGLQEQVIESLRGADRFMYEIFCSGMYECDACDERGIFLNEKDEAHVLMKDLRAAARDYMADHFPGQRAADYNLLERTAREWFGAKTVKVQGKQNANKVVIFPSLVECREHASRVKNVKVPGSETAH